MAEDNFFDDQKNVTNANDYINKAFLNTLDEGTYFTLSKSTIVGLDIIPKLKPDGMPDTSSSGGATSSRSNTSVFAVLNRCRTISGQKLLAMWLQNPLKSKEKIKLRLELVQHFMDDYRLRSMCYDDYLKKVPDLMRMAFKISREKCNLNDLMKVYNTCNLFKNLCVSQRSMTQPTTSDSLQELFKWIDGSCTNLDEFMSLIEATIDVESMDESGEYMVKPECDDSIAKISLEISSLMSKAKQLLNRVADEIGLEAAKSVKLETDPEKGFGFKVTKQNEQAIRGLSNYEQLSTVKKDGFRFTSRELNRLSDKYVSAKQDYKIASKNLIEDLISKTTVFDSEILELSMGITMLDVFVSLATSAHQNTYSLPEISVSEAGIIEFHELRHPCVECQPDVESYVSNDITLNRKDKNFYIITGPNMGGKSTFIKSVAVGVIMAQIGSFVPAERSHVSIVDGVFTRVGAGDKQMEGISTFMEEMMDMATITKNANVNSLVIIDELGRGTSTFDGFGLAWGISKQLASHIRCYALFATHFLELTELSTETSTVGNLNVKVSCQDDKLTMLFKVDEGISDESYGINVARYTKFPDSVIEVATKRLKQFEEVPGFSTKQEVRDFVKECVSVYKRRCPRIV